MTVSVAGMGRFSGGRPFQDDAINKTRILRDAKSTSHHDGYKSEANFYFIVSIIIIIDLGLPGAYLV